jgi:hypothetical protein
MSKLDCFNSALVFPGRRHGSDETRGAAKEDVGKRCSHPFLLDTFSEHGRSCAECMRFHLQSKGRAKIPSLKTQSSGFMVK